MMLEVWASPGTNPNDNQPLFSSFDVDYFVYQNIGNVGDVLIDSGTANNFSVSQGYNYLYLDMPDDLLLNQSPVISVKHGYHRLSSTGAAQPLETLSIDPTIQSSRSARRLCDARFSQISTR